MSNEQKGKEIMRTRNRITKALALSASFVGLLPLAWAAKVQALPARTFVSVAGNDANDCSLATPCRTFGGAAPKTTAGGEITALDSGMYGVITISKALTIQAAPGVHAELGSGTSTSPVTISVGAPDVVVLRHLHFSARKTRAGTTPRGIELLTGGALHVENCVITGFTDSGIHFNLDDGFCDNQNAGCPELYVKDSIARNNGVGINVSGVVASIDRARVENNGTGFRIQSQAFVTIRDSVAAGNTIFGLRGSAVSVTNVENCVVTNNGTGIRAENSGTFDYPVFYVSNTMIVGNVTGLSLSPPGGRIISFGNNRLANNGTSGSFTSTIPQQ
jgi:hypothetical protein